MTKLSQANFSEHANFSNDWEIAGDSIRKRATLPPTLQRPLARQSSRHPCSVSTEGISATAFPLYSTEGLAVTAYVAAECISLITFANISHHHTRLYPVLRTHPGYTAAPSVTLL